MLLLKPYSTVPQCSTVLIVLVIVVTEFLFFFFLTKKNIHTKHSNPSYFHAQKNKQNKKIPPTLPPSKQTKKNKHLVSKVELCWPPGWNNFGTNAVAQRRSLLLYVQVHFYHRCLNELFSSYHVFRFTAFLFQSLVFTSRVSASSRCRACELYLDGQSMTFSYFY